MDAAAGQQQEAQLSLAAVRDALVREEDSVVFALIERARHPRNAPAYAPATGGGRSLVEFFVREAEALQSKAGRYQKPEDVPFFPQDLPSHLFPAKSYPKVLHPVASLVSVNDAIWKMYFNELLPLFTVDGDDGNYAEMAALDFACLQVISRRIHIGKYVAEVKFIDAPQDYSPAIQAKHLEEVWFFPLSICTWQLALGICKKIIIWPKLFCMCMSEATWFIFSCSESLVIVLLVLFICLTVFKVLKDKDTLMNLLTFKAVEEKVKRRVEKKARTFGQNVMLEDNADKQENVAEDSECKVDPKVLSKLYDQWVMPLTKDVEVEYLLRRLD